ncbi:MAG: hypothetical protein R3E21_08065 [Caenibius sp.]
MIEQRTTAELAAAAYLRAQDAASRQIATGRITHGVAHAKLRPWLAIAAWCNAELQDLWQPCTPVFGSTDTRCRLYAHEIAPRSEWASTLAEARDAALDRLTPDSTDQALTHARILCALASAISLDPNGTDHIPPYGAQQRKAA